MAVGFTVQTRIVRRDKSAVNSSETVRQEIKQALEALVQPVEEAVRSKMRQGVTGEERASVLASVEVAETSVGLKVQSPLISALVDEQGLPPGNFPPFGPASALYNWCVERIGLESDGPAQGGRARDFRALAFLVARQQFERGLPGPKDQLRRPFATTQQEYTPQIREAMREARKRVVKRIQNGTP